MIRFFLSTISILLVTSTSFGHGDLHERIMKVSEEIRVHSDSAYLYFKRSKLYYQHNNFTNSINDLKSSKKLGYKSDEQLFLLAKNYYRTNQYNKSKKHLKKLLKRQPYHVNVLKLLGKVHFKKNDYKKSAIVFDKVLSSSTESNLENYLNASRSWLSSGTNTGMNRGQSILLQGIQVFGNNIVLYKELISNYVETGDFSSAIRLQRKVIEFSHRKERGYFKLASLHLYQNNYSEALRCLELAKESFNNLPNRIKATDFMQEFFNELELKEQMLQNIFTKEDEQ